MSIIKILESAICAPSGDNCQPWKFLVKDNQIDIFNIPEKDTSLFNLHQKASLIAHGALIENLMIASSALGYKADLKLFPDQKNKNHIGTVLLQKDDIKEEPLYPFIAQRTTNRKPYKPVPLTKEQQRNLLKKPEDVKTGEIKLFEELQEKTLIAQAISINDRIVFENPYLHNFLFAQIRWTEEEALKTRDGLYIKTLEINAAQAVGFRMLKNWSIQNTLNLFGLSRFIGKQSEKLCHSASVLGGVIVDTNSEEGFLTGGRLLQRVWLESTKMGLSFHLMTGLTLLIERLVTRNTEGLSSSHTKKIQNAYEMIKSAFRLKKETVAVLFRIGHSDPPSARSLRLPVEKVITTT